MPPLRRYAIAAAVWRVLPLAGYVALALTRPDPAAVVVVLCVEGFCAGLLTTTLFALMMSRVDRAIGATHFTVLASVEVLGKLPGQMASGVIAAAVGYPALFAFGAACQLLGLALLRWRVVEPRRVVVEGEGPAAVH